MAIGASFEYGEVITLAADLSKAGPVTLTKASKIVRATALAVEGDAKVIVPVDTGFLKGSIQSDVGFLEAEVGPTASYGGYVEYGTSRMSPQPYMGPAFDKNKDGFERGIAEISDDFL